MKKLNKIFFLTKLNRFGFYGNVNQQYPYTKINKYDPSLKYLKAKYSDNKVYKGWAKLGQVPGVNGCSAKKNVYKQWRPYKLKNHKGLLSRIIITGPVHKRVFLHKRAGMKKFQLKQLGSAKRKKRGLVKISTTDIKRLKKMIPYYKSEVLRRSQLYFKNKEQLILMKQQKDIQTANTKVGSEFTSKKVKSEMLTENDNQNIFWWQQKQDDSNLKKWNYLEHNGVLFPKVFKTQNLSVLYNGRECKLNQYQEEIIQFWVQSIGSEFHKNEFYKQNFSKIFISSFQNQLTELGVDKIEEIDFDLFNFQNVQNHLDKKKEIQKAMSWEDKKIKKKKDDLIADQFRYAIIDGNLEKIGNFRIEPRSIFKGRGKHPQSGKIKDNIVPEDIILNLSKHSPVPICPLPGRAWGMTQSKKECAWLTHYKENCTNNSKYVILGGSSQIKGKSDFKKFEKARELKKRIIEIRNSYQKQMKSVSMKERQLGTATYVIDRLAIRAGNEKGDDKADTVGCCSLRKEHVTLKEDFQIEFDFLGKDSIQYKNSIKVSELCYNNFKYFLDKKDGKDQLFDQIDTSKLNEYLQSKMWGLTAKVFRTFNASSTLQDQLDLTINKIDKNTSLQQKLDLYDEANKQVAVLCNHQKGITKKMQESLQNLRNKIESQKKELKKLKKKTKEFERQQKKLNKLEHDLQKKEGNLGIATSTSKTNYNDPRISVAWCKKTETQIEKIFTKVLMEKFVWAMQTNMKWKF